ncbi:hypothetical protein YC2023_016123 [Brassica napus]
MAAAWRCTHDTGSLDRTPMAAAVEELAVLGEARSRVESTAVEESRRGTNRGQGGGAAVAERLEDVAVSWSGPATREEEAARDLRQTRSCTAACQNGLMKSLWSWHSAERFSRAGRRGRALR